MAITGTGLDSQKGILADTAIWFHIIRVSHAVRKVGDGLCYLISSHYLVRFPILVENLTTHYPPPMPCLVLPLTLPHPPHPEKMALAACWRKPPAAFSPPPWTNPRWSPRWWSGCPRPCWRPPSSWPSAWGKCEGQVSPCGRWRSGLRGGSCRRGLVRSCQPSVEGFHRWRREAQTGSCRGVRDHGRSQGRLPAATGDRFHKDRTRDTTRSS